MITIKELSDDNMGKLHKLGMVDAQRADRIGPAARLLEEAEEIHVFDHHMDKDSDVNATQLVVERVGSVTTIIVEMLEAQRLRLREAEATLFALGIHADTGSLTYEASTPRYKFGLQSPSCCSLHWRETDPFLASYYRAQGCQGPSMANGERCQPSGRQCLQACKPQP